MWFSNYSSESLERSILISTTRAKGNSRHAGADPTRELGCVGARVQLFYGCNKPDATISHSTVPDKAPVGFLFVGQRAEVGINH